MLTGGILECNGRMEIARVNRARGRCICYNRQLRSVAQLQENRVAAKSLRFCNGLTLSWLSPTIAL